MDKPHSDMESFRSNAYSGKIHTITSNTIFIHA